MKREKGREKGREKKIHLVRKRANGKGKGGKQTRKPERDQAKAKEGVTSAILQRLYLHLQH